MKDTHPQILAEKLMKALEGNDEPYVFSKGEVAEIQALLKLFRRLETLRWAGKYALWALVTFGLILSNLERIKDFFK